MPSVTWAMAAVCSSMAFTTMDMVAVTLAACAPVCSRDSVTVCTDWLPSVTAWMELSISSFVALAASSDLEARLRTSSATTAKPFPAVPARAASTAAFRARILVWNAMFSMVAMILEISSEDLEIFSMALLSSLTCSMLMPSCAPALSTYSPDSFVAAAVFTALLEISEIVAASSSTALACSTAPWLRLWEPLET